MWASFQFLREPMGGNRRAEQKAKAPIATGRLGIDLTRGGDGGYPDAAEPKLNNPKCDIQSQFPPAFSDTMSRFTLELLN